MSNTKHPPLFSPNYGNFPIQHRSTAEVQMQLDFHCLQRMSVFLCRFSSTLRPYLLDWRSVCLSTAWQHPSLGKRSHSVLHNSEAMECGIKFAIIAFLSTTDGRCDGHDSALFESSAECATTEGYGRHLDDDDGGASSCLCIFYFAS